jgi:hypothetical protein
VENNAEHESFFYQYVSADASAQEAVSRVPQQFH